jgi:EmrB/QacA subfamily drug resistance transporter
MSLAPSDVRVIIIGAMMALFLSALDQTIVATALPPIANDLGDFALISWVVTSYLLSSTCVTPVVGKLSDIYGRRRMLTIALVVFILGSALSALAPNMIALILARGLQGLGGGGLLTLGQTIIADVVSPRERGRYAVYFSIVWASASLLGPIIGGFVTEYYGWPWIFWINLPIGLATLLIADRALRKLPAERHRSSVDVVSIALLSGATIALLLVLSLGGKRMSWTGLQSLGLAAAALILGGLFAWKQLRSPEPILPPRFIRDRVIGPVLAVTFITYASYMAVAVLAPIYFQVALGAPVSEAGVLMIPLMLSSTLTSNVAGRYTRRHGRYKRPPYFSLPLTIATLGVLALFADRLSTPAASIILMLAGFGFGPIFPCCNVAALNAVGRRELGALNGAVVFSRALGGAIGVAAASALVLGLASAVLSHAGSIGNLEDLVRQTLPPEARAAVARAFGIMFGAAALALSLALAIFGLVEDRELGDSAPAAAVRAAD